VITETLNGRRDGSRAVSPFAFDESTLSCATQRAHFVFRIAFRGILQPGSFVMRANGVRYDVFAHAQSENHEIIGPVHAGTR